YLCYFPTPFDVDFKFIHRFLLLFFRLPALWMFRLAGKLTGGFSSVEVEEGLYEPKRFMLRRGSWTSGRAVLKMRGIDILSLGVKNPLNSVLESMNVRVTISETGKGNVGEYSTVLARGQRKKIRIPTVSGVGAESGNKKYIIEIISDTFKPAESGSGSGDTRNLGAVIYDETAVNPVKKLVLRILGYIPLFLITYPRHNSFLDTYQRIISISEYSSRWINKYWKKESTILFPPVDTDTFGIGGKNIKEKAILSVGRFFPEHHNKKQYELAATFIKMIEKYPEGMKGYTLYLAGGVSNIAGHQEYVESIRKLSAGYPIEVLANVSFERLAGLFKKASVFWHASGLGEDENAHPEKFEHFGITTVEAMSAGCIPVVINRGGQKEIITDGVDGFFFDGLQELSDITLKIIRGEVDSDRLRENAFKNCHRFSNSRFEKKLLSIVKELTNI
ncbi:MAG: glycosyltransferase, partial [Actinobacteria bacterium]|nr:glycosyltransferase [Actinomycetota bacterium]